MMNSLIAYVRKSSALVRRIGLACLLAAAWLNPRAAEAQTIHVSIGSNTITFPSANPATTPSIPANENPIGLTFGYTGPSIGTWVVLLTANGDLTSGAQTIPVSAVHYSGTGSITTSGTLVKGVALTVGSGNLVSPPVSSSLNFTFDNSWNYALGVYSTSALVTVIAL